jgi:exodeoxyribonuclease V beta subunit
MNETHASVEEFDLTNHAVVEASAGTGKTYTIERLVFRLLTVQGATLDQILLVTFTEKATGELKSRMRGMLEKAAQSDDQYAPALKNALDHFDQAPIFTIHGFCQRLLQEYALEQGQDFSASLVDDFDLLQTALRDIQRKTWRTTFGSNLKAVLECAGYNRDTADKWDRKVLDIARSYKPRCGHQLRPDCINDWHQRIDEAGANWIGQLEMFTVNALHDYLRAYKRERGLHSFDDMIASVEENLDPALNADAVRFADMLRERYRYGIVDEFQDTDPLQWRIFRRIFLDAGDSRLIVVGDPKQAIFGFRGADLPTYLQAAEEMKSKHQACDYPLTVNWRSDPDLIEGLNSLFGGGDWFPRSAGIRYLNVHWPDDDKRQSRVHVDRTDRAALSIIDMGHCSTLKIAQKQYARFVAFEIQRLLDDSLGPRLIVSLKNSPQRAINASDCCILVMKRSDAEPITQALDLAGIPYSFYKETGLWHSDEALHVEMLLQTLAKPDDPASLRKALLTCFFRVAPAALAQCLDVPSHHPARQLFQTWLGYAEHRQWSALFHSLLEDTGLLFSPLPPGESEHFSPLPLGEGPGVREGQHSPSTISSAEEPRSPLTPGPSPKRRGEKCITNLRQILATLEQVGHGCNLDLLGLIDWFQNRRQVRDAGETEMQPTDSVKPRVKIMTIHASKGLEFPIVFLAGGFTKMPAGAVATYRDDADRIVFDLRSEAEGDIKDRISADVLSENRRLFYVALTRPIFKLYLPKIQIPRNKTWLGPLGTVVLPALDQACPDKHGPLIAEIVKPPIGPFSLTPPQERSEPVDAPKPIAIDGPLFPDLDPNLGKRRIVVRSFSSMTRHHLSQVGVGSSYGETALPVDDETAAAPERDDPLRGPVFGDMVHNVLEAIDFTEVKRAARHEDLIAPGTHARKLVDSEIRANVGKLRTRAPRESLEQACRQQIALLVWHALRTPLAGIGKSLCEIPAEDRLHEVEFQYPEFVGDSVSTKFRREDGFITGFIDLVFRCERKYYLVDFKTNLLAGYTQEQLAASMDDADYHRQYQLYLQALLRWLTRMHGPRFQFREAFAGVYYLYVRGMNGRDDATGVFFHEPSEQDLDLRHVLTR